MDRRRFVMTALAAGLLPSGCSLGVAGSEVSDICALNPVTVAAIERPRSTDESTARNDR